MEQAVLRYTRCAVLCCASPGVHTGSGGGGGGRRVRWTLLTVVCCPALMHPVYCSHACTGIQGAGRGSQGVGEVHQLRKQTVCQLTTACWHRYNTRLQCVVLGQKPTGEQLRLPQLLIQDWPQEAAAKAGVRMHLPRLPPAIHLLESMHALLAGKAARSPPSGAHSLPRP